MEDSNKYISCDVTDMIELHAFLGILYLRGSKKLNTSSCRDVFLHENALDVFTGFRFSCECHHLFIKTGDQSDGDTISLQRFGTSLRE